MNRPCPKLNLPAAACVEEPAAPTEQGAEYRRAGADFASTGVALGACERAREFVASSQRIPALAALTNARIGVCSEAALATLSTARLPEDRE